MMREVSVFSILVLFLLTTNTAFCQDYPKAEVYGGYSYVNIDTNDLSARQSANGWEASVSGNFNKWLGVEGSVAGYYKGYDLTVVGLGSAHVSVSDYFFGGGPRLNFRPFFVHALVGGDHLTGSALGVSLSQDSLSGAFGGGVQVPVSPRLSVRASGDYVFSRHNILGGPSVTQNNVRVGAGIVYSFGGRSTTTRSSSSPRENGMAVPPLGIRAITPQNGGAEIVEVAPNSVAELAGLRVQDVIQSVDGKLIRSAMELAAELSNRTPGTKVKLGYMIHGAWQAETTLILGGNH
jgi:hypothetical protein